VVTRWSHHGKAAFGRLQAWREVDAHHPSRSLWLACPISLGRGVARLSARTSRLLYSGITRKIHHELAVLVKGLPAQDFGEQVSRVGITRDVAYAHYACAAQLTHLKSFRC